MQATIVQPKTCMIMKTRAYLSLGALLLFLAPLGCSDKAESPAPETPPEEQPTPEPEKPEFVDANKSMEEYMKTEDPDCYYTYFRMQNASQENVIFFISTKMSASGDMIRIAPGEQGTWGQTMEKMSWIDDNDVLVKNLDALGFVELYFNVPPAEDINYRLVSYRDDTCAMYSFFEPMTEAQHGTPRDQSAWVLEEFPDRPNAVRWTYRITDKDYKEAVRQTLKRWADRDEEKQ
ncbi:hypothetical protein [Alistipes putredinis]|uniref:hypothetical protein n=1 Tax=Alistipes putredinis TaxID=28117 RepID=UPI003AB2CE48